jgi:hypothetical protein
VNVVAETPELDHGETTENPTPMPNAKRTNVMAREAVAPAKTALKLTVDSVSSTARFPVSMTMMPNLPEGVTI